VRRSRETVKRSDLAGWAGYGYERSHPRRYWGLKLYLLAAPDGMTVAWGLATPKLGEREVAAALLGVASDQGLLRPGMVIAADKGVTGPSMQPSPWPRAAGSWSWVGSSSGAGPPRMAAPAQWSRSWPRSWVSACGGRRRRRPERRGAPSTSGLSLRVI
jgi:hypothetical protein